MNPIALFSGFTAIGQHDVGVIVALLSTQALVIGSVEVLLVVLAIEILHIGDAGVGFLTAAFGAGSAIGVVAAAALISRRRLSPALLGGAIVWGCSLGLIALLPTQLLAPLLITLAGIGRTIIDLSSLTLLQRVVPDRVLVRVFGMLEGLDMIGMAAGFIVAPLLFAVAGNRATFAIVGLVLPVLAVAIRGRLVRLDAIADVPEARVAVLRTVPFFGSLGQLTLERIARRLLPVQEDAETTLIRQGDRGDRFYMLTSGEVEVTVGGRVVDRHGPGGYFGEIALLKDVPRTATVRTTTDSSLFALEREDFLDALIGHDESRRAADTVARERLERGAHGDDEVVSGMEAGERRDAPLSNGELPHDLSVPSASGVIETVDTGQAK